ncbi:MAG: DegT/DnrJ/EryC1/StrS family aminotransferase [Candidatus Thorarchaeota archaeon]
MSDKKEIKVSDLSYDKSEIDAVVSVLESEWLTMGPKTEEFERRLASYLGSDYAIALNNGTSALHLGLLALGVGSGDEVIVPPISFVATANVVLYTGARPVFSDIDIATFNLDPAGVEASITKKTRAIIPVHLAGLPAEIDALIRIAREHDIGILDDAAHAIGAEYRGKRIGSLGDVTAFSFFSNKNLSVGEGGAISTNNEEAANELKLMRSHGLSKSTWSRYHLHDEESLDQLYDMKSLGYNYRMTEIAAAIGCVQLDKVDSFNSRRKALYEIYKDHLEDMYLDLQMIPSHVVHSHHILPVLIPRGTRPRVRAMLRDKGIGTSIHYTPIHKFSYYQKNGYSRISMPNAEEMGARVITLPLHQKLADEDVQRVVNELQTALSS